NFESLEEEIIETGICTHCGACLSVCPDYNIEWGEDEKPHRKKVKGMCENCTECYDGCHSVEGHFDDKEIDEMVFGRVKNDDEPLGIFKRIVSAQATDEEILKYAQDGGVVSAIVSYLFDNEKIDGVITTGRNKEDGGWKPRAKIAKSKEEFIATAGTKYYIAPILSQLKVGVIDEMLDRLAVIGLPCQIRSTRFLEKINFDLAPAIFYTIGIFCTQNYNYADLENAIQENGIQINDIEKMYVEKGFYHVVSDSKEIKIPLKDMKEWVNSFCQYCTDYSSEFADISIGNQASESGWSTVIIRTDKGEELFNNLEEEGYITTKEIDSADILISNSKIKRKNAKNPF
ncbi:MAG: hypothetical protein EU549_02415, partial [Promethearchaeota archaeon]